MSPATIDAGTAIIRLQPGQTARFPNGTSFHNGLTAALDVVFEVSTSTIIAMQGCADELTLVEQRGRG